MDIAALLAGFYVGTSVAGFATMYLVKVPLQRKLDSLSSRLKNLETAAGIATEDEPLNENTKGEVTTEEHKAPLPICRS